MPTQKSAPLSSEATPWAAADSPGSGTDSTIARYDVLASILLAARMAGGVCVDVQNGTRIWLTLPPTKQQDAQAAGPPDATTTQQRTTKASRPPSYYRRSTERLQDRIAENQAKHQPRPDQQPPRMPPGMPPPPTMPPPPAAAVADAMDADAPPPPPPEEPPPPPPPRPHQQPHQQPPIAEPRMSQPDVQQQPVDPSPTVIAPKPAPTAEPRMPQPDVQQQPADPSPTVIAPKPAHTGSGVAATASMDPPPWCRHRLHGAATAATAPLPKRSRSLEDAFNDAADDSKRPENDSTLALRRAPPPPPPQAPPLLPPGLAAEPRPLATAWSTVVVRGALRTPPRPVASRERSQPASPFPPGWQNLGPPRRTSPAARRLALATEAAARAAQSVARLATSPIAMAVGVSASSASATDAFTSLLTALPILVLFLLTMAIVASLTAPPSRRRSKRDAFIHTIRPDALELQSPESLRTTPTTSTTPTLREKQLVAVVHIDLWLKTLDTVNAYRRLPSAAPSLQPHHGTVRPPHLHAPRPSRAPTRAYRTPSSWRPTSPESLRTTPTTSTTPRLREKQLVAVVHNDLWLTTTSFFAHHLRLTPLAAVIGAALPVALWAKPRKSHLLSGAPLAGLLPVVM